MLFIIDRVKKLNLFCILIVASLIGKYSQTLNNNWSPVSLIYIILRNKYYIIYIEVLDDQDSSNGALFHRVRFLCLVLFTIDLALLQRTTKAATGHIYCWLLAKMEMRAAMRENNSEGSQMRLVYMLRTQEHTLRHCAAVRAAFINDRTPGQLDAVKLDSICHTHDTCH